MSENQDIKFLEILVFWINEDRRQEYIKLVQKNQSRKPSDEELQRFQETLISNRNDIKKEAEDLFNDFIKNAQSKNNPWWKNHILIETGYTAPTLVSLLVLCLLLFQNKVPTDYLSVWGRYATIFTTLISIVMTIIYTALKIFNKNSKSS